MNHPLISIIMPTFNRAHTIKKSIDSVVLQSYKNWELIIIDDGSTDETEKLVSNYNEKRIFYYKQSLNQGAPVARKNGIQCSNGAFIAFLDSDDLYHKNKLEKQFYLYLKLNSPVILCDFFEVRGNNKIKHTLIDYSQNQLKQILKCPGPLFQCMLIHKDSIPNLENYMDENLVSSQEWDFTIQLFLKGINFTNVNEALVTWNIQNDSISLDYNKSAIGYQVIIEKYKNEILNQVGRNILSDHYRRIARLWEGANNLQEAKKNYKNAYFNSFFNIKNIFYYYLTIFGYPKRFYKFVKFIRKFYLAGNE
jgi:glycosyltransferase involved in cell wall biosynthesis